MGLVVDGPVGTPATGDTWVAILEYDLEIRKEALRRVQKGLKLATAMKEAWQDVEVKMKYFMDPVLMGKRKRADDEASYDNRKAKEEARTHNFHSEIKGKGKTKGKKEKARASQRARRRPARARPQMAIRSATLPTTLSNGAMGATGHTCAGGVSKRASLCTIATTQGGARRHRHLHGSVSPPRGVSPPPRRGYRKKKQF